jgi:hemoglobin
VTPYEQFGGEPFFTALVASFYARLATDPVLRALYPGTDLGPAEERLRMFLEQNWSGPGTYSERRGPPRLRMRHAPFAIDQDAHDRWLRHMRAALDEQALPPDLDATLWTYLVAAAAHLVNR